MGIDDTVEFYENTQVVRDRMMKSETERLKLEKEFIRLNSTDDVQYV
jgi:hypothetical protein